MFISSVLLSGAINRILFFSVHVPSLEVQGRTRPNVQKWIYLNRKIKCFLLHYCSSNCLDSNGKDEFVWYHDENLSDFIVLWCLCKHHLILVWLQMCVWLMHVTYMLLYLCATFLSGQHIWWTQTHTRTCASTGDVSSNRYPIAASWGRVLLHLSALPGKGRASSDAIVTNGCIKRFSVPTILPTPRWAV